MYAFYLGISDFKIFFRQSVAKIVGENSKISLAIRSMSE